MTASKFVTAAAVILIGGVASLAPTMSRAQQAMPAASSDSSLPSFEDLDKNHQGFITRSEIPKDVEGLKSLRMHFAESDSNNNGRIDKAEYQAYVARMQPAQGAAGGDQPAQPMQH